jgi:hypothetical protein
MKQLATTGLAACALALIGSGGACGGSTIENTDSGGAADGSAGGSASSSSGASSGSSGASSGGAPDGSTIDGGQAQCGAVLCPPGRVCCDHCTGSCVPGGAGVMCPDDNNPNHACTDGSSGCAQSGASCLQTACCTGLQCCVGVPIPPGQAFCYEGGCPMSDRNAKAGFTPVSDDEVLSGLMTLPVTRWHYRFEPPEVQHIGPMAQDFKAAFGVGTDDKHIFQIDADGVSFAAIQALGRRIEALSLAQDSLERDNAELRLRVKYLEREVEASKGRP